jgi:hypothetical protein
MIYGTTKTFLELFGLSTISELPSLKEVVPPETEPPGTEEAEPKTEGKGPPPSDSNLVESEIEEVLGEIDHSGDEDDS